MATKTPNARVLAVYLPQFHPVDVNDTYWGKGFTEWTNVASAKPLYPGHYQPHIPRDLGFYDLRLSEVREAQAQMAKDAGIEGFMYWHYWFGNGQRVLERPFEEVLSSGKPDFPFCLAWANHPWRTDSWHNSGKFKTQSIFEMHYSEEDFITHFNHVLPAFKDSRYVKVDGKPVFAIFSLFDFPLRRKFIETWRALAQQNGLPGIYFIGMRIGRKDLSAEEYLADGFDAINETLIWIAERKMRGNLIIKRGITLLSKLFNLPLQGYNFKKAIRWFTSEEARQTYMIPTVLSGFDHTPRSGRKAIFFYNYNPNTFKLHLRNVMEHIKDKPADKRLIILKSWNEWGEGNHIEPDLKYGHAYLDELRKALFEERY